MSNILIQNKGELPIWGIRLLGLSTKTEEQIGKFGTGLKESIALLSRLGSLPVIYSGTCRIDFSVRGEPSEIHFRLSEDRDQFSADEWYGLGIHPDFGKADWDDPWMIFREIICNAIDESGTEDLFHDVISTEPEGVAGATRVYIPSGGDLLVAYTTVQDKILALGSHETLAALPEGRTILKKRIGKMHEPAQIYHRGVWVQEANKKSVFDYDLQTLELNESRSADWYDVNNHISKAILAMPVEMVVQLLQRLMAGGGDELFECEVLPYASRLASVYSAGNWVEGFKQLYGEFAVVTDNDKFFYDRLNSTGKTPVVVKDSDLRSFLEECGVPNVHTTLSEPDRRWERMITPSEEVQEEFNKIWSRFVEVGLAESSKQPGLMLFEPRLGSAEATLGCYRDEICYVNMRTVGSKEFRVTCIEEICHHLSGAGDFTLTFEKYLIECVDRFAMERTCTKK